MTTAMKADAYQFFGTLIVTFLSLSAVWWLARMSVGFPIVFTEIAGVSAAVAVMRAQIGEPRGSR